MLGLFSILISAVLVNNFVLSKFLGICPFLGVSKKIQTAMGMSLAVIFVMVISSAATWAVQTALLKPNGLEYLTTITYILIIAALVQLVETIMKKFMPPLYNALGIYLPLITTNCAVLGVTIINTDSNFGLVESLVNSFGGGVGFMIGLLMFAGVRERLENADIPKGFKGMPSTLIAACLVALSFLGFSGLADGVVNFVNR